MAVQQADLVLGGGGVRGAALVGAVDALHQRGVQVNRVAGASAGALIGALVVGGATPERIRERVRALDYSAFALSGFVDRLAGSALGSLFERFGPDTVEPLAWIEEALEEVGIRTWGDLADEGPPPRTPPSQRYRLVVRCLDVANRRVVRLPWDYDRYGLVAEEQSVAEAVRASMTVPLVFEPVAVGDPEVGTGLLVDGGLASGFGVSVLDRQDGEPPRWPSIGVRLLPRFGSGELPEGDVAIVRAVLTTVLATGDDTLPTGRRDESRTVEVDTSSVLSLDVRDDPEAEQALDRAGESAMRAFLDSYDHDAWIDRHVRHGHAAE